LNQDPSSLSIRSVAIAAVLVIAGFIGGQLAPTVVTLGGPSANQRPDFAQLSDIYDVLVKKF